MRETHRSEEGWTLIEILVVVSIIATLAGLTSIVVLKAQRESQTVECKTHVSELVRLLESVGDGRYPQQDGPNLLLYLVQRGEIAGDDMLANLFCPGDMNEDLARAGREAAYKDLDLTRVGEYGHLTSYAGRALRDKGCRAKRGMPRPVVLVADDSEDHHNDKGIVVGLTGGAAKFRDKYDDYGLGEDQPLVVGEGSAAEELRCLRVD